MNPLGGAAPITVQPGPPLCQITAGIGGSGARFARQGFEACIAPPQFPLAHRRPFRRPVLDSHSCDADVTAQKKILAFPPIAARPLFSRLATGQSFRNVMPEMFLPPATSCRTSQDP